MFEEQSVNVAKLYQITLHPRDKGQPIHFPFVRTTAKEGHTVIWKYLACGFASKALRDWYKPIRQAVVSEINDSKLKQFTEPPKEEEKKRDPSKPVCPGCFNQSLRYRVKTKDWVCKICGRTFKSDEGGGPE